MGKVIEFEVNFSKKEVLQKLGWKKGAEMGKGLDLLIDEAINEGKRIIEPAAIYDVLDIMPGFDGIYIYNDNARTYFKSSFLAKRFKDDRKAALFVTTIGLRLEERRNSLKDEMAEYVILDAIGSVAAEKSARYVNREIAKEFGLKEARRWSPGYSDWKLEEQEMVFRLLNPGAIGVGLTARFYMQPEKSVSAICRVQQ